MLTTNQDMADGVKPDVADVEMVHISGTKTSNERTVSTKASKTVDHPNYKEKMQPANGPLPARLISLLNRTNYKVEVTHHLRKYGGPPPDGTPRPQGTELFVGKLARNCFEDELVPLFEPYGTLWEIRILTDPDNQTGRGFAVVTYVHAESCSKAVSALNEKPVRTISEQKLTLTVTPNQQRLLAGSAVDDKTRNEILDAFKAGESATDWGTDINDTDEGFADGKSMTNTNALRNANPAVSGSVDDDTYDCPLSTHSDYSSSARSGVVTPGSENNANGNGEHENDDESNTENINTLQQPVLASLHAKNASAEHHTEQQWPKDHPRNPRRDPNLCDLRFRFRIPNAAYMRQNVLSPAHYLRGLPWKIYIMPKHTTDQFRRNWPQHTPTVPPEKTSISYLGIFLQCNAEDTSISWSCHGEAKIRLIDENNEVVMDRSIVHNFYQKENDWGFTQYMECGKADWQKAVHARDGALLIEVEATADPPHGTNWNSKSLTGYVGLKNQGATCYMNSLLQALYFTNYLRRAVYLISTELEDPSKSIPFQLQRLFFDLQVSSKPASTKRLTQAFGWDSIDSLVQHDVEEFCRMLLDNLEDKLKGTPMEGAINQLFEGRTISYIKCKEINYTSSRVETFMDVALNVKGLANVQDSFREYCTTDDLVGDNQYDAGAHGKQDAVKGIKFVQFPPVLHLHLKRFTYDIQTGDFVKINEKFEFPQHLDLTPYLDTDLYMNELLQQQQQLQQQLLSGDADPESTANSNSSDNIASLIAHQPPPLYSLHAVFVHSGDHHGGHYVCYINPNCDGVSWYKFDDDVVSKCQARQATEGNYGGRNDTSSRSCSNAYMLVYVRDFDRDRVLCPVKHTDLNPMFFIRLNRQTTLDTRFEQREPASTEPHVTFKLLRDSDLRHAGVQPGMFDLQLLQNPLLSVRMNVNDTWRQAHCKLADMLQVPPSSIRMWPLCRDNTEGQGGGGSNPGFNAAHKFRPQYVYGGHVTPVSDAVNKVVGNVSADAVLQQQQLNAADDNVHFHMDRRITYDLQLSKPPRVSLHHHSSQQSPSVIPAVVNNDEYYLWLQEASNGQLLPLTSHSTHVLLFIKLYDPKYSLLHLERSVLVRLDEGENYRCTIDDLYDQLKTIVPSCVPSTRAEELYTWFESRAKELTAIRLPPNLSQTSLYRELEVPARSLSSVIPETQAMKLFNTAIQFDGEAVIVQRAVRSADMDRYKFPTAPSYVYEQVNLIKLVLQEREGGSTLAGSTTSAVSATLSNTSLTSSSTGNNNATGQQQRMSSPATARTHWPELTFEVSQLLPLSEFQKMVADRLGIDDQRKIMFSKLTTQNHGGNLKQGSAASFGGNSISGSNSSFRDSQPITQLNKVNLGEVVGVVPLAAAATAPKRRKILLYTVLPMPIEDFDSKKEIEICYLPDLRDALDNGGSGGLERTLFVNQHARVSDLLNVVRQQFSLPNDVPLRLLETINSSFRQPPLRDNLEIAAALFENSAKNKTFRVEPVPPDQRLLAQSPTCTLSSAPHVLPVASSATAFTSGGVRAGTPTPAERAEILMPVQHFHKNWCDFFGTPFIVRAVEGDTWKTVRERIRCVLGFSEKDMEKCRLGFYHMGKRHSTDEDENERFPVAELVRIRTAPSPASWAQLWLGLDHVNNNAGRGSSIAPGTVASGQLKKVRAAAEKTLKIHN